MEKSFFIIAASFLGGVGISLIGVGLRILRDPDYYERQHQIARQKIERKSRSVAINTRTNEWVQP